MFHKSAYDVSEAAIKAACVMVGRDALDVAGDDPLEPCAYISSDLSRPLVLYGVGVPVGLARDYIEEAFRVATWLFHVQAAMISPSPALTSRGTRPNPEAEPCLLIDCLSRVGSWRLVAGVTDGVLDLSRLVFHPVFAVTTLGAHAFRSAPSMWTDLPQAFLDGPPPLASGQHRPLVETNPWKGADSQQVAPTEMPQFDVVLAPRVHFDFAGHPSSRHLIALSALRTGRRQVSEVLRLANDVVDALLPGHCAALLSKAAEPHRESWRPVGLS